MYSKGGAVSCTTKRCNRNLARNPAHLLSQIVETTFVGTCVTSAALASNLMCKSCRGSRALLVDTYGSACSPLEEGASFKLSFFGTATRSFSLLPPTDVRARFVKPIIKRIDNLQHPSGTCYLVEYSCTYYRVKLCRRLGLDMLHFLCRLETVKRLKPPLDMLVECMLIGPAKI